MRTPPAPLAREWHFVPDDGPWTERIWAEDPSVLPVFADWLEEQGDSRAAMIRRGLRGDAFDAFVAANAKALVGDLEPLLSRRTPAGRPELELTWRSGILRGASVRPHENPWQVVAALLERPVAAYLSSLAVGAHYPLSYGGEAPAETLHVLQHPRASGIRRLVIGDHEYAECMISSTHLGDVSDLWSVAPQLRELKLRGLVDRLGPIASPNLRRFVRETGGLKREELRAMCNAAWPELEHLEVWFGDPNYGAECSVADVEPLLRREGLPKLTSLSLCNAEFADELVERVVSSPLLPQLRRLDLSKGCMSNDGARVLLTARARLAHLDVLDLSQNMLSGELDAELATLAPQMTLADQRLEEADLELRYVAVGE